MEYMSEKQVLKWDVPVNNQGHVVGGGPVVHVACQHSPDFVQIWTEEELDAEPSFRVVRIFGTGQLIPVDSVHLGSTVTANGSLVWHAYGERR